MIHEGTTQHVFGGLLARTVQLRDPAPHDRLSMLEVRRPPRCNPASTVPRAAGWVSDLAFLISGEPATTSVPNRPNIHNPESEVRLGVLNF